MSSSQAKPARRRINGISLLAIQILFVSFLAHAQSGYVAYSIPPGTIGNHATPGLEIGDDFVVLNPGLNG